MGYQIMLINQEPIVQVSHVFLLYRLFAAACAGWSRRNWRPISAGDKDAKWGYGRTTNFWALNQNAQVTKHESLSPKCCNGLINDQTPILELRTLFYFDKTTFQDIGQNGPTAAPEWMPAKYPHAAVPSGQVWQPSPTKSFDFIHRLEWHVQTLVTI